ncbi:unnamed protein product [Aphis gossypii]|uniref:Uncharacterized protein n=1 Tax=Aphis gossypii TaxID=80765 RepID=A0A9P0IZ97_APHGO|nr:unnamed protein product [Aphis gossypii]
MTMAEVEMEPPTDRASRSTIYKTNNNHPLATNNNNHLHHVPSARPVVVKHKKRKRLNQVLDRLAGQATSPNNNNNNNNNSNHNNNNNNNIEIDVVAVKEEEPEIKETDGSVTATVVVDSGHVSNGVGYESDESLRRSSCKDSYEEPFSPAGSSSCNRSPRSSHTDSPFSPNRTRPDDPPAPHLQQPQFHPAPLLPPHPLHHYLKYPKCDCLFCGGDGTSPPRHPLPPMPPPPSQQHLNHLQNSKNSSQQPPVTPMSPASLLAGSMYTFEHYLHTKYLPDIFRKRRSHSDSDVPMWFEATKAEHCNSGAGGGGVNDDSTASTAAAVRVTTSAAGTGSRRGKRPFSVPHPLDKPARKRGPASCRSSAPPPPPQPPQDLPLDLSMKNGFWPFAAPEPPAVRTVRLHGRGRQRRRDDAFASATAGHRLFRRHSSYDVGRVGGLLQPARQRGRLHRARGQGRRGVAHHQGFGGRPVQPGSVARRRGDARRLGRGVRVSGVRTDVQPARSAGQAHGVPAQNVGVGVVVVGRHRDGGELVVVRERRRRRLVRRRGQGVPVRGVQPVVRAQRHAHPAHATAHGRQAVHLSRVRPGVLAVRPPEHPPAHAHRRKTVQVSAVSVRRVPPGHDHPAHAHPLPVRDGLVVVGVRRRCHGGRAGPGPAVAHLAHRRPTVAVAPARGPLQVRTAVAVLQSSAPQCGRSYYYYYYIMLKRITFVTIF